MPTILTERKTWKRERVAPSRLTADLTPDEQANVRRALHVLRRRFEGWPKAAKALGVNWKTLQRASAAEGKPTAGVALRVARVAGVTVEAILAGEWPKAGACPMCGKSESDGLRSNGGSVT